MIIATISIAVSIGPNGIIEKAQESQLDSRYAAIIDKVKIRENDILISFSRNEEGEHQKDFIERLIAENLITSNDDYDNINYKTIYLKKVVANATTFNKFNYLLLILSNSLFKRSKVSK